MKIYSMSNEDLAEVLELLTRHDRFKDWDVYGFPDNKDTRYRAIAFLQEAASRLVKMSDDENAKAETADEECTVGETTIVIPTPPEEPKPEEPKPDEEPTPTEREVLKKAVVMLAEAVKDRSSSSAFDTCNKVLEMMRKLEK